MKKFTKKQKLNLMGKIVDVTAIYSGSSLERRLIKINKRAGWVTGFSHIREGDIDFDPEDGNIFIPSKTYLIVKVRFWMNSKEVNVPYEHIKLNPLGKPYSELAKYSEICKEMYKEEKEFFPRNSKGQFIKLKEGQWHRPRY